MRRTLIVIATCLAGLAVAGCGEAPKVTEFTLTQSAPQIEVTDVGPKGDSPDDVFEFVGNLSRDGRPAGHVTGETHIAEMPNTGGVDTGGREERLVLMSFNLPEGELMVVGQSSYHVGEKNLDPGEPMTRPVVGGTKDHIGARGEVTSIKQPDGSYVHRFRLID
jgi:hypothetical protein